MMDPLLWLGVSTVALIISLTILLSVAVPVLWEIAKTARSAEKLLETLNRELPPTLEAIRLTGLELTDLTEDVGDGVQRAGRVVQRVDQGVDRVKQQANQLQAVARGSVAGFRAAWKVFRTPKANS
ncbi:MAG: DUF948 domain-containing protein [Merismopedia sp. SIO2A8]|nr:DUF948 domain-containing protein [Symploca sp. SIO2B6]NET48057.1 DUF948 domain-containing protein [Merismopedia sp. SIO2A8]